MDGLQEYIVPVTAAICYCLGFIIKKWVKDVDNKLIPTVCAILGVVINIWVMGGFSPTVLLGGLVSGLGATGIDQLVKTVTTKA